MRALAQIELILLEQRGHLFPWAPVCLGLGIGIYFSLLWEPGWPVYGVLIGGIVVCVLLALWRPGGLAAFAWGIALLALGFCLAGWRAHSLAGPVLDWRYYGAIEGRIVGLDRSASDAVRVTLDTVVLERVRPEKRPNRVRLSLHGPPATLIPGQRIMTTGHLSPPQGPVEPGGFDFRRHAWFQGLGAVGYTRNPVLTVAPPEEGQAGLAVFSLRMAMSRHVIESIGGDVGGFAAAVTTGDRSGMSQEALIALRASNLAHLLAISGLHMGLLAGFVFAALRIGLSLVPAIALRFPVKKIAAVGALGAGAFYLLLSGGSVATERAFIMASVVLCAVLLDRRAFSLRAVAVAALIVLVLRPESLLGPGFQMSFAATTALVAVFGWMRDANLPKAPKWSLPVLGVLMSSGVAGLATAPVGAAHFNMLAHYGLIANLVSVPLMGALVIPAAVLAAVLSPFGLDFIGLWMMGLGLRWILGVGHFVTGLDGANSFVVSPDPIVLPMLCLGALWLILWQNRARFVGLVPMLAAFVIWAQADRPMALVADTGGLIGVMTDEGRALSKAKGAGFIARNWLENDGERVEQSVAAGRWPGGQNKVQITRLGELELIHVIGKRAAAQYQGCRENQLIVSSVPLKLDGPCAVYDPKRLARTGSLSIDPARIVTAADRAGARIWNRRPSRRGRRMAKAQ